jgi:hypothetical protein
MARRVRGHAWHHAYSGPNIRIAAHPSTYARGRSALEPALGYSIGQWIDTDGDGKFDLLEVETRSFTGLRAYDASGIPLHDDNQTIVKERIYLDKSDANTLIFDVTVIDNALTRPWSVRKTYRRQSDPQPLWIEVCGEGNNHVQIGKENIRSAATGLDAHQKAASADLGYFTRSANDGASAPFRSS